MIQEEDFFTKSERLHIFTKSKKWNALLDPLG
jgi:hypothetical protein